MIDPNNITTISRQRPPLYQDFEQLRAEGIRHLETLATHIWTDFNAHDPGITILEVLCYALTDLGYRTDLPFEDLMAVAPGSDEKVFFLADEALTNCPVTENDFRKLIIDVPGVKNAWLRKAEGEYPMHFGAAAVTFYPEGEENQENRCEYYPIEKGAGNNADDRLKLNGLYKVVLELHDNSLEPYHDATKRIMAEVKHRLMANRNLCEDFVEICLIEKQQICLCIDLDIAAHADAKETMAKALFTLQEFLTPTIKFQNLQQLLEEGLCGDEIYDGPILQNGFINDDELTQAQIPTVIQLSDLYSTLETIPEILNVRDIKFLNNGGPNAWCFILEEGKKPVIDPCCSRLWVNQNGMTKELEGKDLEELIAFNELINQDLPASEIAALSYPEGTYRPDLAEYTPIQYEFPRTYHLGDNGLPDSTTTKRKAQAEQLKAYLLFYDRLLANYLQKLSKVRDIFSMSQDVDSPTVFFQSLEQVPGMKELVYTLTAEKAALIKDLIHADYFEEEHLEHIHSEIDEEVGELLDNQVELEEWVTAWVAQLENSADEANFRATVEKLFERIIIGPAAYYQALEKIAFGQDDQQERKNVIFDHLLARFGERFTDYTLDIFSQTETAKQETFSNYLDDKSAYLNRLPSLVAGRAKAYNYKLFKKERSEPDVWNTDNVSGLKKRVCALLGMDASESSVLCDPNYRVNLKKDSAKRSAYYFLELVSLSDEVDTRSGSRLSEDTLMISQKSYRKKTAKAYEAILYEHLGTHDGFSDPTTIESGEEGLLTFTVPVDDSKTLVMQTEPLRRRGAIQCLADILELLETSDCDKEGFHILEHILLRPNDEGDDLLMPPSFCGEDNASPLDPYSFWISVILPGWIKRFKEPTYRQFFEQTFLRETPAHIAVCFRWVEEEDQQWMKGFEYAFETWREARANCPADECKMTREANELIDYLTRMPCPCLCNDETDLEPNCPPAESTGGGSIA